MLTLKGMEALGSSSFPFSGPKTSGPLLDAIYNNGSCKEQLYLIDTYSYHNFIGHEAQGAICGDRSFIIAYVLVLAFGSSSSNVQATLKMNGSVCRTSFTPWKLAHFMYTLQRLRYNLCLGMS